MTNALFSAKQDHHYQRRQYANVSCFWIKTFMFCFKTLSPVQSSSESNYFLKYSPGLRMQFGPLFDNKTWPKWEKIASKHIYLNFLTLTCWVTFSLATPTFPWTILTGSVSTSLAKISILFLNVAENREHCRSLLTWLQMDRTWGSNPISNIRSASSRTEQIEIFEQKQKQF